MASPVVQTADLVNYIIHANGKEIDTTYQITSIFVDRAINRIPSCEIEILDGNVATEDFPISDAPTFVPGTEIEVLTGYEENTQTIFKGIIIKHAIKIKKDAGTVLLITCKDKAVKLTVGRKNKYYTKTKDSDIISAIASAAGLQANVADTGTPMPEVVQYYASDWDFIVSRADLNGMVVIADSGALTVKSPDKLDSDVLSMTYGYDILEFEGEIDAENQYKAVKSTAWDYKQQQIITGNAQAGNFGSDLSTPTLADVIGLASYDLQSGGFLAPPALSSWAKGQAQRSAYAKVKGTIRFQGNATIQPGMLMDLAGVGNRFNGKVFVSGITHQVHDGNWITVAELGLPPESFTTAVRTESPQASGLLPGISGLQIGIVRQIDSDPDEALRILIDLPLVGTGGSGVWARLANPYASSGFGTFFFPEINDEVVVGFFNDDPCFPVILGALYSSARNAGYTPDKKNNIKALLTRSKLKIEFDEEKKSITIATPGNNKAELSDDGKSITLSDQNNNVIKMSASGIEINSASSITIKAAQAITAEATTGATVKASGGDLTLQGMNLSAKGEMSLTAQGGVSAELTASGEVKVQGAMVMVN